MSFRILHAFVAAALWVVPVGAASAQDSAVARTMRGWGLFGTFAVNCRVDGWRLTWGVNGAGRAVHNRYRNGRFLDSSRISRARVTRNGWLAVTIAFRNGSRVNVIRRGPDGRIRAWINYAVKDRSYSVRNGRLIHNGAPTPWQERGR